MRMREINEAARSWVGDINGSAIHEITTRSELARELKKHGYLRGFLFPDRAFVWDGYGAVHPDAAEYLRQYNYDTEGFEHGVPVHIESGRLTIRHHGMDEAGVRGMYEQVMASPIIQRLFRGGVEVWADDGEHIEERLDNKDWGDTEASDWTDDWAIY